MVVGTITLNAAVIMERSLTATGAAAIPDSP
jgi:hypothetical protein